MATKDQDQLAFDADIYTQPEPEKTAPEIEPARPAKPKLSTKPASPSTTALQPFLPGLSRRGRPRSKNPVPANVRALESRKRRLAAGNKRIELLLAPETAADLELLTEHYRVSRLEVIVRLVAKAAKRIRSAGTA